MTISETMRGTVLVTISRDDYEIIRECLSIPLMRTMDAIHHRGHGTITLDATYAQLAEIGDASNACGIL